MQEINQRNIKGKRDGLWVEYYENGKKAAEINYRNGKRHGLSKYYHVIGDKLHSETFFSNGKINGAYKSYHQNGKIAHESFFKNGVLILPSKTYSLYGILIKENIFIK